MDHKSFFSFIVDWPNFGLTFCSTRWGWRGLDEVKCRWCNKQKVWVHFIAPTFNMRTFTTMYSRLYTGKWSGDFLMVTVLSTGGHRAKKFTCNYTTFNLILVVLWFLFSRITTTINTKSGRFLWDGRANCHVNGGVSFAGKHTLSSGVMSCC